MRLSLSGFDQRQTFAAPMADGGDDDLSQWTIHRALDARLVGRRIKFTTADRDRGQRHVHWNLRLEPMSDVGAGGADGNVLMFGEEGALLGGGGRRAARAGNDRSLAGRQPRRDLGPQMLQPRG